MHLRTLVDQLGVLERFVEVVVDKRERQLAKDGIEERVTRHSVRDRKQAMLKRSVLLHQLFANVVRNDLSVMLLSISHLTVERIRCQGLYLQLLQNLKIDEAAQIRQHTFHYVGLLIFRLCLNC